MKKDYTTPEVNITVINSTDVITVSQADTQSGSAIKNVAMSEIDF